MIGENPAQSEADINADARSCCESLDFLIVQDIFLTKTARATPTSCSRRRRPGARPRARSPTRERRVQRVRKALDAAGRGPRRHRGSCASSPAGWATTGATRPPRRSGTSCARSRRCTPACATSGWRRWAASSGRAPTRSIPARRSCTAGCGPSRSRGRRRRSRSSSTDPPVDALDDDYPMRLTTGRRLESYNTGVQSSRLPLAAAPAARRSTSRPRTPSALLRRGGRGRPRLVAARRASRRPCASTAALRPGLAFMTLPLPRRGRREPADDRRHRPEVGHRRVQGRRDPGREDRARAARQVASRAVLVEAIDGPPLLDAEATEAERAAVDAVLGPPASGWDGGVRERGHDGRLAAAATPRGRSATCCCRRSTRCRSASAGSARARSTTSASASTCRPPTPTAWRRSTRCSRSSRGRRAVLHVCDDLACRCGGSQELIAAARGARSAPRARRTARRRGSAARASGQCDRAPAAHADGRRRAPARSSVLAPVDAATALRGRWTQDAVRQPPPHPPLPQPGDPGLRLLRRVGRVDPTSLDDYRAHGRLRGAAAGPRARARAASSARSRTRSSRPRRRRLPDRRQVGSRGAPAGPARTTSSATPTSPSRARSRTAC